MSRMRKKDFDDIDQVHIGEIDDGKGKMPDTDGGDDEDWADEPASEFIKEMIGFDPDEEPDKNYKLPKRMQKVFDANCKRMGIL